MDENREKELKDGMRMKGSEGGDVWRRARGGKEDGEHEMGEGASLQKKG